MTVASASLVEKRESSQQEDEQQESMDVEQEKKDKTDQCAEAKEPPATEVRDVKKFLIILTTACYI